MTFCSGSQVTDQTTVVKLIGVCNLQWDVGTVQKDSLCVFEREHEIMPKWNKTEQSIYIPNVEEKNIIYQWINYWNKIFLRINHKIQNVHINSSLLKD